MIIFIKVNVNFVNLRGRGLKDRDHQNLDADTNKINKKDSAAVDGVMIPL